MLKVVADISIPFLKGALEPFLRVEYREGRLITNAILLDANALITRTRTLCNAMLLDKTEVKLIASATIGHDHIDKGYCDAFGIKWVSAPGCNSGSVKQYIASALAVVLRELGKPPGEVTLGVIGAGNVGKKVINLAAAIGIKTLVNDPPRSRAEGSAGFCSLDELLPNSDIVTIHVPLSLYGEDSTHHLAGESFFQKAKSGAWLINTSRGEVVNTESMKKALKAKKLAGAVVDVWENEPNIDLELLQLASIATPHIAGYSVEGKANGTTMVVRETSRFFGLGIDDWSPSHIPPPPKPLLQVPDMAKSRIQIFEDLSIQAYPILEDHQMLVKNPSNFEDFRSNYPIRREPPAIQVVTHGLSEDAVRMILDLGYGII